MIQASLNSQSVSCYECLDVSFSLIRDYDNPFDPREIQADGHFTRPDGQVVVMPGFLYQDCSRRLAENDCEVIEKIGEPVWKIRFARPHLFGEFGPPLMRGFMDLRTLDPEGVHLRHAIWATTLCGGSGTALTWWWDSYVHPNNLYQLFTPLVTFCEGVPWSTAGFKPLQAAKASWAQPSMPRPPRDL